MPLFRASHVADNIYQLTGEALQRRLVGWEMLKRATPRGPSGVPRPAEK